MSLRIGLIGGNVDTGWAAETHIPCIAALTGLELAAVATTRAESAEHAARTLGIRHAFTSAAELARCEDVDLVVVSVKAPDHEQAVMAALDAGKPVLCEWPLGADSAQAARMAARARAAGLLAVIGLQARNAPEIAHARDLILGGDIGTVNMVAVRGAYPLWGDGMVSAMTADRRNGATLLSIPGGHALDAAQFIVGDRVSSVSAELATVRREVRAAGSREMIAMTAPDHVAVSGRFAGGALFSMTLVGGVSNQGTRIAVFGSRGTLMIDAEMLIQNSPVTLCAARGAGALEDLDVPEAAATPAGRARNVGLAYARLLRDPQSLPDFDDALALHRLLDGIDAASGSGHAQAVAAA